MRIWAALCTKSVLPQKGGVRAVASGHYWPIQLAKGRSSCMRSANITQKEKAAMQIVGKDLLDMNDAELSKRIKDKSIKEIKEQ